MDPTSSSSFFNDSQERLSSFMSPAASSSEPASSLEEGTSRPTNTAKRSRNSLNSFSVGQNFLSSFDTIQDLISQAFIGLEEADSETQYGVGKNLLDRSKKMSDQWTKNLIKAQAFKCFELSAQKLYIPAIREMAYLCRKMKFYEVEPVYRMFCQLDTRDRDDEERYNRFCEEPRCHCIECPQQYQVEHIRDEGAKHLHKILKNNPPHLTELFLTDKRSIDSGDSWIVKGLKRNTTLKTLYLDDSAQGAFLGNQVLPRSLTELSISYLNIDTDLRLLGDVLNSQIRLNRLDISLPISRNHLRTRGGRSLTQTRLVRLNPNEQPIRLTSNPHSHEGVLHITQALSQNTTLKSLKLGGIFHQEWLPLIHYFTTHNSTLRCLGLSQSCIGPAHLGKFLASNSTLTKLDVSSNPLMNTDLSGFIQGVIKNTTLISLKLANNKITDARSLVQLISCSTSLARLNANKNPLSEEGLHSLLQALSDNTSLTAFSALQSHDFSYISFEHEIADLFNRNTTLKSLDINLSRSMIINSELVYRAAVTNPTLSYFSPYPIPDEKVNLKGFEGRFNEVLLRNQHNRERQLMTLFRLMRPFLIRE